MRRIGRLEDTSKARWNPYIKALRCKGPLLIDMSHVVASISKLTRRGGLRAPADRPPPASSQDPTPIQETKEAPIRHPAEEAKRLSDEKQRYYKEKDEEKRQQRRAEEDKRKEREEYNERMEERNRYRRMVDKARRPSRNSSSDEDMDKARRPPNQSSSNKNVDKAKSTHQSSCSSDEDMSDGESSSSSSSSDSKGTVSDSHSLRFEGEWKITIPQERFTKYERFSMLELTPSQHSIEHSTISGHLSPLTSSVPTSISLVSSGSQMRLFHGSIEVAEARRKEPAFTGNVDSETSPVVRTQVLAHLSNHPSSAKHNRGVQILRAWHGTSVAVAKSILRTGFANLATLDDGWFGKGIYFSTNPEYASYYCLSKSEPCLLQCFVVIFNPFPVIWHDARSVWLPLAKIASKLLAQPEELRFVNQANYKNFGCHYVTVSQYSKNDFRPPQEGIGKFDEIVVFNEAHILPYALVTIKPCESPVEATVFASPKPNKEILKWSCDDVCNWMKSLPLSKDYSAEVNVNYLNGAALATMENQEDWRGLGVTTFGDVRILMRAVGELIKYGR